MTYSEYHNQRIIETEKQNMDLPKKVWEFIVNGGDYNKSSVNPKYYESISKKLDKYSKEEKISKKELCHELLKLDGLALKQVLILWAIKPERQNLNEIWKSDFIKETYNYDVSILNKMGPDSLYLDEEFNISPKIVNKGQTYEKSNNGMKSFDFIIKGWKYSTDGFDGILTVDKTTKVTGGSQNDIMREVLATVNHLSKDPKKRNYLIILDGSFWEKFLNEMKNKYENLHFVNSDIMN
jgi:hypothetical protein